MQPGHAAQQRLRQVRDVPRVADRVNGHRPHAGVVIGEGEPRGLAADGEREREAERRELPAPLPLAAFREDERVLPEQAERARRVPGAATDLGRAARDDVTREMPDYAERTHGPEA